jgi:hypothetical protein
LQFSLKAASPETFGCTLVFSKYVLKLNYKYAAVEGTTATPLVRVRLYRCKFLDIVS